MKELNKKMIVPLSTSFLFSAGLALGFVPMPLGTFQPIQVEADTVYYKTTSNLNMRTGASTNKSIITTIPQGKEVTYVSKSGNWYKVKYSNKTGWVSSNYLKKVATAVKTNTQVASSTAKTTIYYTTSSNLNMRSGASTKKSVITTIPKGKKVTYVSKSGSWFKVKYGSKTGWVSSSYLKNKTTVVTNQQTVASSTAKAIKYKTTSNLNMRSGASTKNSIVTTIPKGKEVTYVSKSGNWYKVKYGSKTGWVSSSYLKKVTTSSDNTTVTSVNINFKTTANLNMRASAANNGKLIVTIPKGKIIKATSKNGNWYKVKYGSKTGWVSASYLKEYDQYSTIKTTYYVTNKVSDLYTSPNTKKAKALSVPVKNIFTSTQKVVNSNGQTWYRVSLKGKNYYIISSSVSAVTPVTLTSTVYEAKVATSLYSSTGDAHGVLVKIPKGAKITTTYRIGDWYKTTYGGKTGYININHFSKYTPPVNNSGNNSNSTNNNTNTGTNTDTETNISKVEYITSSDLNLRASDSTSSAILTLIPKETILIPTKKTSSGWYQVSYKGKSGYVSGNYLIEYTKSIADQIEKYSKNPYISMDLRTKSSVTAAQINNYINNRVGTRPSVLKNSGQHFIDAANKHGLNALFLAAHAIHESGFGTSTISLAKNNLFGFGAFDLTPFVGAYKFDSIKSNIDYIAQELKATYLNPKNWKYNGAYLGYTIKDAKGKRIDALSKGINFYYASDSNWGNAIASHMEKMLPYSNEGAKNQNPNLTVPSVPAKPTGKDTFPTGTVAVANADITVQNDKGKVTIKKGEKFYLLEKSNDYKLTVKYNGVTYYTYAVSFSKYNQYFTVKNLARVNASVLNIRDAANGSVIIGKLQNYQYVELMVDKELNLITKDGWYQIKFVENGTNKIGWVSGDYLIRELNK